MYEDNTIKARIAAVREALDRLEELTAEEADALASPPIPDDKLLKWRRIGDDFYNTIQYHLGVQVIGIGQYDSPRGLIIQLTDTIGLQIVANYNHYTAGEHKGEVVTGEDFNVDLDLKFVKLPKGDWLSDPVDKRNIGFW